jgi:Flp pilus assembly protein TadG
MSGHAGQRPRERRGRVAGERGQATVEVALLVPVVSLLVLAVVQVGVLVHEQLLVTAAAREAVRAAAVSPEPESARRAASTVGGLATDRLQISVAREPVQGGAVRVTLAYLSRTEVPLAGALLPDVEMRAEATMRSET